MRTGKKDNSLLCCPVLTPCRACQWCSPRCSGESAQCEQCNLRPSLGADDLGRCQCPQSYGRGDLGQIFLEKHLFTKLLPMKKIFSSEIEIFTFSHRPVCPQTLLVTASNKPHAAVVSGGVLHREPEGESSLVGQVQPVGLVLMPGGLHQTAPLLGDEHVEVELHVGPEEVPGELEDPGVEDRLGHGDLQIQRGPHHLV